MSERIREKLSILADAAKYDVSCSSSGSKRKNKDKGLGDTTGMGICHAYTEDGRCVSLLKILLTNFCIYDCAYCVSRRSNDIQRAAFTVEEVVDLTMNFYRRNYIEGLFLSSGRPIICIRITNSNVSIEPDFNVLPLISPHFQSRYADQRWLIFDKRRKQGIFYDLTKVETVEALVIEDDSSANGIALELDAGEKLYQHLWKDYFTHTNIPARKNLKLHLQHVPTRYWRYLTEKKAG